MTGNSSGVSLDSLDGGHLACTMVGTELVITGSVLALALAVVVGLVAHEWSHALVLRLAAIDHTISYAPGRGRGIVGLVRSCPWAVVQPQPTGDEPPWILRVAALAPLILAVPAFGLVAAGYVTDDLSIGTAAILGWLACSIPSPQDFAVVFHAHTVLEDDHPSEADTTAHISHAD